jgi:type IV secretory pathway TrbF-like protein
MWFTSKPKTDEANPDRVRYSRYYEHDGALRAYANRSMGLAFSSLAIALLSVAFAAYVRIQPPTVIRVDANGEASVVGKNKPFISVSQNAAEAEATEIEKRAFVKLFLERYLNFSPFNVSRNWSEALNMMTANLRHSAMDNMQKDNLIGKIEDDQTRSDFQLRRLEVSKESPLTYSAFGVKEIHHVHEDHSETTEKIVSEFRIRLVMEKRTEQNANGLLIGEYWEQPIEGEKRNVVLEETGLTAQQ